MTIFLIGFMGCGKTTLGKKLAAKLSSDFIDLDKLIESEIGMSIPEYFREVGEHGFRLKEKEILQQYPFPPNAVVATGGGAPCFFDNLEWMNAHGTTVYISLSPKALASRLESATEERPVLQGLKGKELEAFIALKLGEREAFYKQAEITIEGMDLTPEKLAVKLQEHYLK